MASESIKNAITAGKTVLGIELGSTRIKAVLIGPDNAPIASGGYSWENRLENGIWTYHLEDVWTGLQECYRNLAEEVRDKYGVSISTVGSIGISAMMHGYLVFDKDDNLLTPFRTWRNTMTAKASDELTQLFGFNVPQRWSVAHLYQAVLNGEPHVKDIHFLTTLAGYVHWKLTGKKVLGLGEASGVLPIDSGSGSYNAGMIKQFDDLVSPHGFAWGLGDILPQTMTAGKNAGTLTAEGAKLIAPDAPLQSGIPMCPPEGDAGTGMVATNSIAPRTGNVSAGTSIFAMAVLEKELGNVYPEIDIVTTPAGAPVAMVHCNNCTSDLDAWVKVFGELMELMGSKVNKPLLYDELYNIALSGDADCGGLLSYNYFSGEHITQLEEGRPLFVRMPGAKFTLANFMRMQLFSTLATLKIGMNILSEQEKVSLDKLLGHGGLFKTKLVGQRMMAAAVGVPVAVMETAGEGGAWGIALLAAYMLNKSPNESLEDFLNNKVFAESKEECVEPNPDDSKGFDVFMQRYSQGLAIERKAVDELR